MNRPSHSEIVKRAARMKKPLPKFDFGKYKDRPVNDVFLDNPEYIVWCWENFRNKSRLPFIEELYHKAKRIVQNMEHDDSDDVDEFDLWAMELANE